jgi:hypothetical protein
VGHIRLGRIPKSKAWAEVVATLSRPSEFSSENSASGSATGRPVGPETESSQSEHASSRGTSLSNDALKRIAAHTLSASEVALQGAMNDEGLRYTFFLLSRVTLASREPEWLEGLRQLGIRLTKDSTPFELTSEFQGAIDRHLRLSSRTTDVSEMAQRAAGEILCNRIGLEAQTLFGSAGPELQNAVRTFSTKKGFGELGQRFFGEFLSRFLNFYLSRLTTSQLGNGAVGELGDITKFRWALGRHCYESAAIVRDFLGEWYSKTEFKEGIDPDNAGGAVAFALKKLQDEIRAQRKEA